MLSKYRKYRANIHETNLVLEISSIDHVIRGCASFNTVLNTVSYNTQVWLKIDCHTPYKLADSFSSA